jgi:broad specificity phosphatase PhoE
VRSFTRGTIHIPGTDCGTSRFLQRISTWFQALLLDHHNRPATKTKGQEPIILVLSHGAYLGGLLNVLANRSFPFKFQCLPGVDVRRSCLNTSVTRVRCEEVEGKWKGQVEGWAEIGHLQGVRDDKVVKEVADDV